MFPMTTGPVVVFVKPSPVYEAHIIDPDPDSVMQRIITICDSFNGSEQAGGAEMISVVERAGEMARVIVVRSSAEKVVRTFL
jgi:hypothetical protein